jgi:hypothetical protein
MSPGLCAPPLRTDLQIPEGTLSPSPRTLARDSAGPGCCPRRYVCNNRGTDSGAATFSCVPSDQTTGAWHL